MAIESVPTDPESYGAEPVHGNYTGDASMHLWCANALSVAVSTPETPLDELNDDIQAAIRYLLSCEIARAMQALAGSARERQERLADMIGDALSEAAAK